MRVLPGLALLAAAAGLAGCVTASIEQQRQGAASRSIAADESVVVLGRQQQGDRHTPDAFAQCVADELDSPGLRVFPRKRFEDALFPWFEPRTAPASPDALPGLLEDAVLAGRLRETGVRYVVWLDGAVRDGDSGGSMGCAVGPGGGGCLGFTWWEKTAAFEAAIWDLEAARGIGRLSVDASGTSYMPAVILPLPLLARTESAACSGLADQVREMLLPAEGD